MIFFCPDFPCLRSSSTLSGGPLLPPFRKIDMAKHLGPVFQLGLVERNPTTPSSPSWALSSPRRCRMKSHSTRNFLVPNFPFLSFLLLNTLTSLAPRFYFSVPNGQSLHVPVFLSRVVPSYFFHSIRTSVSFILSLPALRVRPGPLPTYQWIHSCPPKFNEELRSFFTCDSFFFRLFYLNGPDPLAYSPVWRTLHLLLIRPKFARMLCISP